MNVGKNGDFFHVFQNRLFTLDRLFPLPTAGLKGFAEGFALHTPRQGVCGEPTSLAAALKV